MGVFGGYRGQMGGVQRGRMVGMGCGSWRWALAVLLIGWAGVSAGDVTFFAWSDQHVTADGDARHLEAVLAEMSRLPGREWPEAIGGKVNRPEFVLGCGDCTDWPTRRAVAAYADATERLPAPAFDVMGNHDEGDVSGGGGIGTGMVVGVLAAMAIGVAGYAVLRIRRRVLRFGVAVVVGLIAGGVMVWFANGRNDAMARWIVARHGALSYSFDRGGVHFVMAFSRYTSPETMSEEALAFVRRDLATVEHGRPVVIATHYCFESIHNRDALIEALGKSNVVLILGGHFHQATLTEYRGRRFVQVPSARYAQAFSVVRVAGSEVSVAVWDARRQAWSERFTLIFTNSKH